MMKVSTPVFQLKVVVGGKSIQEYHKDGQAFVEGRQGSNFALELTNLTPRRALVHPTVDGLSAMTGKEASRRDNKHGYVLGPFQEVLVPGWRLNDEEVAQFFFAGAGKSYAEKTGKGRDKGVIACAVWEEISRFSINTVSGWRPSGGGQLFGSGGGGSVPTLDCHFMDTGDAAPVSADSPVANAIDETKSAGGLQAEMCSVEPERRTRSRKRLLRTAGVQNLGTGFGERTEHHVQTTTFNSATEEPICVATIYYDDLDGLRARGIRISRKARRKPRLPNPFPRDKGCCKPPPGWRG